MTWLLQQAKRQQRLLYGTLGASVAFSIFWLVAMTTDNWAHLTLPPGGVRLASRQQGVRTDVIVTKLYIGLWRHCRVELINSSVEIAPSAADNADVKRNSSQTMNAGAYDNEPTVRLKPCKNFAGYLSLWESKFGALRFDCPQLLGIKNHSCEGFYFELQVHSWRRLHTKPKELRFFHFKERGANFLLIHRWLEAERLVHWVR